MIAVAAGALLVVAVAAGWVLLALFGSGSEADKIQLDAIRTVGTIVLGAGGAFALLLAARRQQTAERDSAARRHDLILRTRADAVIEHDSEQRRVTELYTQAAEQLGHEKAAVRLAGVYALERLAQNYPDQRRPVVSLLCAYLRMPYHGSDRLDPEKLKSESSNSGQQTQENRGEREVRRAVQRLLHDHAHNAPEADTSPSPTYWGTGDPATDIEVDLSGATLIDLDFSRRRMHPTSNFNNATFIGRTNFIHTAFVGEGGFDKAHFADAAYFENAIFEQDAHFAGARFADSAYFNRANFKGTTWATGAEFEGGAEFLKTRFHVGLFERAIFRNVALFKGATFEECSFGGAIFYADANFGHTSHSGTSWFIRARFMAQSYFHGARFHECVFEETEFAKDASFRGAWFNCIANFAGACFQGFALFHDTRFRSVARFSESTFAGDTTFENAKVLMASDCWWPPGWKLDAALEDGQPENDSDWDCPLPAHQPESKSTRMLGVLNQDTRFFRDDEREVR